MTRVKRLISLITLLTFVSGSLAYSSGETMLRPLARLERPDPSTMPMEVRGLFRRIEHFKSFVLIVMQPQDGEEERKIEKALQATQRYRDLLLMLCLHPRSTSAQIAKHLWAWYHRKDTDPIPEADDAFANDVTRRLINLGRIGAAQAGKKAAREGAASATYYYSPAEGLFPPKTTANDEAYGKVVAAVFANNKLFRPLQYDAILSQVPPSAAAAAIRDKLMELAARSGHPLAEEQIVFTDDFGNRTSILTQRLRDRSKTTPSPLPARSGKHQPRRQIALLIDGGRSILNKSKVGHIAFQTRSADNDRQTIVTFLPPPDAYTLVNIQGKKAAELPDIIIAAVADVSEVIVSTPDDSAQRLAEGKAKAKKKRAAVTAPLDAAVLAACEALCALHTYATSTDVAASLAEAGFDTSFNRGQAWCAPRDGEDPEHPDPTAILNVSSGAKNVISTSLDRLVDAGALERLPERKLLVNPRIPNFNASQNAYRVRGPALVPAAPAPDMMATNV
ncbi:MAG: hypothetical protein WCG78_04815 [Candidatus Omnitrophota bacterium]